jgi:hypothetical protein
MNILPQVAKGECCPQVKIIALEEALTDARWLLDFWRSLAAVLTVSVLVLAGVVWYLL